MEQRCEAREAKVELGSITGFDCWVLVQRSDILDNRQRMRQHVFVPMNRIVFKLHRRQFGQKLIGQTVLDQKPQASSRMVNDHQLVELVANPLSRHDLQAI